MDDLQAGKAGEYLVCADLIIKGYVAYLSDQGLPYDVVMDYNGKLLKVQVKTTRNHKFILQRKTSIPAYIFNIGTNGKNNRRKKYDLNQVDLFALVALDTKTICYIENNRIKTTMNFRVQEYKGKYRDEQAQQIKDKVIAFRKQGICCHDIASELKLKLSNVYKYSSNVSLEQKGTNAGVYMNDFTLEKCLQKI